MPLGEQLLWSTRLLLLGGVIGSAVLAIAVTWMGTVDLLRFIGDVSEYTTADDVSTLRDDLVASVVKIVDTYLFVAILVLVAFGLYELFIGRLDARRSDDDAPRLLVANSLEELKDRIAKVVVLILVIEFFQRSLRVTVDDADDLLAIAAGIVLVSLALVLPNLADAVKRSRTDDRPDHASGPDADRPGAA